MFTKRYLRNNSETQQYVHVQQYRKGIAQKKLNTVQERCIIVYIHKQNISKVPHAFTSVVFCSVAEMMPGSEMDGKTHAL